MSIASAMAALSTPPEASPVQSQGVPSTPIPKEGPASLAEAIKPVKQDSKPGADRFAILAKQERALRQREAQLKAGAAKQAEWEKARQEATTNPLKALEALGLSYEQITQFMLNGSKPTPELELQSVKQEMAAFRKEQEDKAIALKAEQESKAKAEYQTTLSEFNSEVDNFIKTHADTYELTNLYEGQSIVSATIEQHFANTKKILSIEEASNLVEKYFEEQVQAATKSKKFQAKQTPKEEGQPRREQAAKSSAPTLSNELTSSAPSMLPAKTENDRMQRAMAALTQGK